MPVDICASGSVTEILHGEIVADPYRWLEDRALPKTDDWIRDQQRRCEDYFSACAGLETIRTRVRSYLDVEVVDQPARVEGRYFYRRRNQGEEQASIYVRDGVSGKERLLVDPAGQGPFTSVSIHRISPSGALLAYELRRGGEDKSAFCVVDTKSGRTVHHGLEVGYAGGFAFRPSDDGFYCCHETRRSAEQHTIRLRRLADPYAGNVVFRTPRTGESRLILTADAVHLGAIWLRRSRSEIVSDFFIAPLQDGSKWIKVFSNHGPSYHPFLHQGRIFAMKMTADGGSAVTELASDGREMHTIIPSTAPPFRQTAIVGDRVYANHFDRGVSSISSWSLTGEYLGLIEAREAGSIALLGSRSQGESNLFYTWESYDQPLITFEYDAERNQTRVWHQRTLMTSQFPSTVRRVSCQTKGGTEIPLTLVAPKDESPARPAPTILTSYGGFGASVSPRFSVLAAIMREFGGILAVAHIRGGGEFGKPWHEAGRKRNRQNAIDDFIAAAEWLCAHGITSPNKLAIFGGSNAGLLVAAAMTQRPDLFRAVLSIAPLLDMVRYERFDRARRWRDEYGTAENVDDFRALYAYSPYHHVEEGVDYPSAMFVSGDKDDRCNPAHVRKMAALLQSRSAQRSPVIVDYSEQRGHVPALPLSTRIEALARRIAFLCKELIVSLPAGGDHEETCC